VDYIMTVAVSVAAGVDNVISAVPEIISAGARAQPLPGGDQPRVHRVPDGMNVRGVRESGRTFAVPAYAVVVGVLAMIAVGLIRTAVGDPPVAESAGYDIRPEQVTITMFSGVTAPALIARRRAVHRAHLRSDPVRGRLRHGSTKDGHRPDRRRGVRRRLAD
jgi:hypothetical protein